MLPAFFYEDIMGKHHESNGGCSLGGLCIGQFNRHYKNEQLRNAGIVMRVKNRLREENIPFETIHDSITVAPEHFAILQRITDEVMQGMMQEMVQPLCTSTDVIQQRIQRKRELAEKCTRYYPVMQRSKGFAQQVAAAETIEGAVTIKDMMERRNRSEEYFIGPRTIVFSNELAALEFEPTELEKAEMKNEAAIAAAQLNQSLQPTEESVCKIVEGLEPKYDRKKYRIISRRLQGTDGEWHQIYIPQKRVFMFFWKDFYNSRINRYVAYTSIEECRIFLNNAPAREKRAHSGE